MSKVKRCSKYKDALTNLKFGPYCRHQNERASMLMSDDMTLFVNGDLHFNCVTIDCLCGSVRQLYDYAIERGILERISRREFCGRLIKWDVDATDVNKNLSIIILKFIDKDEWNVVCTDVEPGKRYNFGCLTTGTLKDIFDIISKRLEKKSFLYKKIVEYDAISPVTKFISTFEGENGLNVVENLTGKSVKSKFEEMISSEKYPSELSDDVSDFIMFVSRRMYFIWFDGGDYSGERPCYRFRDSVFKRFEFTVESSKQNSKFTLNFSGGLLGYGKKRSYKVKNWRELELRINNLTGIDGCKLMED